MPLVRNKDQFIRVDQVSQKAKEEINAFLQYHPKKYASLDFKI